MAGSDRADAALTIVAPGTRVTGEIESTGVVKIEGIVIGTVRAERQVLVARDGKVEGDIVTNESIIGGRVDGGIQAADRIEIQGGAVVNGDVSTKRLVVQEGGEVNGLVKMTGSEPGSGAAKQ